MPGTRPAISHDNLYARFGSTLAPALLDDRRNVLAQANHN
jgi:hypothetical protein